MSEWYKEWFGSDAYLSVYAHRDDSEADNLLTFLFAKLQLQTGDSVLDLCCGAGRHTLAFAKRGCTVTGLDLSENLLRIAKEKAKDFPNVSFIQKNILEFEPEEQYKLVVNLFTSFGYFCNDSLNFSLFTAAAKSVQKKGFFVFDYLNAEFLKKRLVPYSSEYRDGLYIEQLRWIKDEAVHKRIILQKDTNLKTFTEYVKLYSSQQIADALHHAGFNDITFFGTYDGGEFDEVTSPRLLAICRL